MSVLVDTHPPSSQIVADVEKTQIKGGLSKPPIRYMFKRGILIANDFINSLPLDRMEKVYQIPGLWILEINKPVKGVFVAVGTSGRILHREEFCAEFECIPGFYAHESFVIGQVIDILDPEKDQLVRKSLRAIFIFIDIERSEGKFLKVPDEKELALTDKKYAKMRVSKVKPTKEEDIHLSRNYRRLGRLLFLNKAYDMVPFGEQHDPDDVSDLEGFMMRAIRKEEERDKKPKPKKSIWDKLLPKKKNKSEFSDGDEDGEGNADNKTLTKKRKTPCSKKPKDNQSDKSCDDSDKEKDEVDDKLEEPQKKKRKYTRKSKKEEVVSTAVDEGKKKRGPKRRLTKEEKSGFTLNKLEIMENSISKEESKTRRIGLLEDDGEVTHLGSHDGNPDQDEKEAGGKIKKQWTTFQMKHQLQYQPQEKSIKPKIVQQSGKRPGERPALSRLPQGSQGLLAQQLSQVPHLQKTEVQSTKSALGSISTLYGKTDPKKIEESKITSLANEADDDDNSSSSDLSEDEEDGKGVWTDSSDAEKEVSENEFGTENEFDELEESEGESRKEKEEYDDEF